MRSRLSPRERRAGGDVAPQDLQRSGQRLVGASSRASLIALGSDSVCRTLLRMTYASSPPTKKWLAPALAVVGRRVPVLYSLPPYFTGGTRVPATFALHYPLLVAHVMFASVAMVTAVAQIWPGLRARRPGAAPSSRAGLRVSRRDPAAVHSRW